MHAWQISLLYTLYLIWGSVTSSARLHNYVPSHVQLNEFEFIGVLRHMQRYFSHICDGTDVQADWRSCTYGRAPNARHRQFVGFFKVPVLHRHWTTFLYGDSDTPPYLVAIYDTLGIRGIYSRIKPRRPHGGMYNWNMVVCDVKQAILTESLLHYLRSPKRGCCLISDDLSCSSEDIS